MRVLTFLHSFEPGGVERVALRLVRQWRQMGIEAPLFVGRRDGALRSELAEDLAYAIPVRSSWSAALETLWMIWTLPGAIRANEPDVLFCAGNTYTIVVLAMKVLLGRRCPPVVAKVSNELLRPGQDPVWRALFRGWAWLQSRFVDAWVVMHPAMRAEVAGLCGATLVTVIPDPALTLRQMERLRAWRPRGRETVGRRFVALGRLVPQKNYEMLLRAFAAGSEPGDRLTIYGEGSSRAMIEQLAAQLDLGPRLRLAGHVAHSASCLIGEDALLMTSHFEGVPASLIEGMTCGMPIVATACGVGVIALVEHYAGGVLVPIGDTAAFAAAIAKLAPVSAPYPWADAGLYTIEAGAAAYAEAFSAVQRAISPTPQHRPIAVGGGLLDQGITASVRTVRSERKGRG